MIGVDGILCLFERYRKESFLKEIFFYLYYNKKDSIDSIMCILFALVSIRSSISVSRKTYARIYSTSYCGYHIIYYINILINYSEKSNGEHHYILYYTSECNNLNPRGDFTTKINNKLP